MEFRLLVIVSIKVLFLLGCSSQSTIEPPTVETKSSYETQVRLHVIGRLIGPDDTFNGAQNPKSLYIISKYTSPEVQAAISYIAWVDRQIKVNWVKEFESIKINEFGEPKKGGAFLTLGKITKERGRFRISASISFSVWGEAGGGATYVYENNEKQWKLVAIEDRWIS